MTETTPLTMKAKFGDKRSLVLPRLPGTDYTLERLPFARKYRQEDYQESR